MALLVKQWLLLSLGIFLAHARPKVPDYEDDVPELYEGDIALTKEQAEILRQSRPTFNKSADWNQEAQTRGAIANPRQLWPDGIIPFVINSRIDARGKQLIRNSIKDWMDHVPCIRFKQRERERGYIEFVYKRGCWSYVGHTGERQELSLGQFTEDPPCVQGAITHELGHAIGFFHEQNRPDRDEYVTINWQNIRNGAEDNFKKAKPNSVDSRGEPYDYGSIMHYSKYAGNIRPGVMTIDAKDPNAEIGQLKGPSKSDIKQARLMYGCGGTKAGGKKPESKPPWPEPAPPRPPPPPGPGRPRPGGPPNSNCIRKVVKFGKLLKIIQICRNPNDDKTTSTTQTQVNSKET
ncbi:nematocyst expressed protein 6 isoform X2 [Pocillopora verrucosa]|uniref:nematocyst expressed protein 6 isoform X2 n=1 Tax=Pocillopora verrucosa TaxID=203993 RepID=UPI00333F0B10